MDIVHRVLIVRSTPIAIVTAAVVAAGLSAAGAEGGDAAVVLVRDFARWEKKRIAESSGLIWWRGHLITTNDSGDEAVLYVADRAGRETARLRYADPDPTDVEALALGPGDTIWVGDIGDNAEQRGSIAVYRIASPTLDRDARVPSTRYDLRYPDGPHNAEALLVHPHSGALFVVTKAVVGGIYRAPQPLRSHGINALTYVGPAPTIVTDATFAPAGDRAYLRGYSTLSVLDYPAFMRQASWPTPAQPQGEGLANGPAGTLLASTEGARSAIQEWRMPALSQAPAPTSPSAPAPPDSSARSSTAAPAATGPAATDGSRTGLVWRAIVPLAAGALSVAGVLALLRTRRTHRRL